MVVVTTKLEESKKYVCVGFAAFVEIILSTG
jgi:hypothetical protein